MSWLEQEALLLSIKNLLIACLHQELKPFKSEIFPLFWSQTWCWNGPVPLWLQHVEYLWGYSTVVYCPRPVACTIAPVTVAAEFLDVNVSSNVWLTWLHLFWYTVTQDSEPRLLNLILLNLIVRLPTERSHYTNNLWNATFSLWKIRIMNGWMVSFEWKTSKHHKNWNLSQLCDFIMRVSVDNYFFRQ